MGKRSKSYLFIDFANCDFKRGNLLRLLIKTVKDHYLYVDGKNNMINKVRYFLDQETFQYLMPINEFISEVIQPAYMLYLKGEFSLNYDEWIIDKITPNDLKKHSSTAGTFYGVARKHQVGLDFILRIAFSQFRFRDILKKIIKKKKFEKVLLDETTKLFVTQAVSLIFGGKGAYLKFKPVNLKIPFGVDFRHYKIEEFFDDVFLGDLVEFLAEKDLRWKKLKQCRACEKFFVSKVNRNDIKHCSKECKQAHWNREYIKSGKHAQYMRRKRPEKPEWIT